MRDSQDIVGGGLLAAIGLFVGIYTLSTYDLGSINRMGPGMLPAVLSVLLVMFGAWIGIPAAFREGEAISIDFRPLGAIAAAVILFGVVLERFGLAPAVAAMTIAAALAERSHVWKRSLMLAVSLVVIAVLIFPVALGLPIRIARWPF